MCIYNQICKNQKYCSIVTQGYYIIYCLIYSVAIVGAFIALSPSGVGTAEVTELNWEGVPLLDTALLFPTSLPV